MTGRSHPTMGAWIEIATTYKTLVIDNDVAPHDGCVD